MNITNILKKFNINKNKYTMFGKDCAKLKLNSKHCVKPANKKLILVTAISPTPSGEGKTTVSIGLNDALNQYQHKSILCLRQPSIGPTLGLKGGATGYGNSQIIPNQLINYGLTGDFYTIETINNLIATVIENHIFQGNKLQIDPKTIAWRRAIDLSDRSLRKIKIKIDKDISYETGFDITAASEIMVILCLSKSLDDFIKRINNSIVAYDKNKKPIYVKAFNLDNAIRILANDLIRPNCIATLKNNLCIMHGGPFANIAHGCNSIIAINEAFKYAKYVVTEAGFGSDLGFEKFVNIIGREYALPDAVVLCATLKSIFYHSKKCADWHETFDIGIKNLIQHVELIRATGYQPIIAINKFTNDRKEHLDYLIKWLKKVKVDFAIVDPTSNNSKSFEPLVKLVVKETKTDKKIDFTYQLNEPLTKKIQNIVSKIYGFDTEVQYEKLAMSKINKFKNFNYYICMAKTPIAFSSDKNNVVYMKTDKVIIKDILISHGAKFIIPICESIFRMPGLPKVPNAQKL